MFPTLAFQGVHTAAAADIPIPPDTIHSAVWPTPCSALCHGSSVSSRFAFRIPAWVYATIMDR